MSMVIDKDVTTVGEIVTHNFGYADVLNRYGIDFCCNGNDTIAVASEKVGVDTDQVIKDIEAFWGKENEGAISFASFPKDLLIDYILKIHHRGIRRNGASIRVLLDKVVKVHGENHPELYEIRSLFAQAMLALESHLVKEEQVLFPYLYDQIDNLLNNRPWSAFHCGSVESPIAVMEDEHSAEGERFHKIIALTHHFTVPSDACESYKLLYSKLHDFAHALFEHIHLENNILFPWALATERQALDE